MLAAYAGHWDFWSLYHKVTFDGVRRLIVVNSGEKSIDMKVDVYSSWKEWARLDDYAKFEPALRAVGGDPVGPGMFAGDLYFLINGWKIYVDHEVELTGIVYSDDGSSPFITPATANVVRSAASNLALAYGMTPEQRTLLDSIELRLRDAAKEITSQVIKGKLAALPVPATAEDLTPLARISDITDAVASIKGGDVTLAQIGTNVLRLLGLNNENSLLDQTVFNAGGKLTSARLRMYDSKVNARAALAASPGEYDTGLVFSWTLSAGWNPSNKAQSLLMERDS